MGVGNVGVVELYCIGVERNFEEEDTDDDDDNNGVDDAVAAL